MIDRMRVALADDETRVRSALALLLQQEPDLEIVSETADATGLLAAVALTAPHLLLLDWELPGLPMKQLMRLLRYEQPMMKVIAMSSRPEAHQAAVLENVYAFVSKGDSPESVLALIREAL